MSPRNHCPMERWIARHFNGHIRAPQEHALRQHLPECASCKRLYERHLLLNRLDPRTTSAQARLAHGLGLVPPRSLTAAWPLLMASAGAALGLLVWFHGRLPGQESPPSYYAARGGAASAALPEQALRVYALRSGQPPALVVERIRSTDELAFSYRNGAGLKRLLVFGVDEHAHVYWYHPAWTDEQSDPHAIPIAGGPELHELHEAISQPLDGTQLTLYAAFSDEPLSVREVEATLAQPGAAAARDQGTWTLPAARVVALRLQVER